MCERVTPSHPRSCGVPPTPVRCTRCESTRVRCTVCAGGPQTASRSRPRPSTAPRGCGTSRRGSVSTPSADTSTHTTHHTVLAGRHGFDPHPPPHSFAVYLSFLLHFVLFYRKEVVAVEYSPDGEYVATAGYDKMVKIWSTKVSFCFLVSFIFYYFCLLF